MFEQTRPSDEASPLLVARSSHNETEAPRVRCAISTEGVTRSRLVVAVGLTWLGSFLAALGTLSLPLQLALYHLLNHKPYRQHHYLDTVSNHRLGIWIPSCYLMVGLYLPDRFSSCSAP